MRIFNTALHLWICLAVSTALTPTRFYNGAGSSVWPTDILKAHVKPGVLQ
jgi:hypothetical protein